MKTLPTAFLIGLAAVATSTAWAEDTEAIKKDKAQLQGEWSMVSGSADGNAMPDAMRETAKRVCKGDETTVTVGGLLLMKAKFTIDPSRKPKTIDYQMTEGFTKGNEILTTKLRNMVKDAFADPVTAKQMPYSKEDLIFLGTIFENFTAP